MPSHPDPEQDRTFSFGPFRLLHVRKQLLEGGRPVRLGSRALELLVALVERPGEVLSRQELEARVWPRTVVEETSLRVHIAALRKALRDGIEGARYITNIPGRGYCFVAPVATALDAGTPGIALALAASRPLNNLPSRLTTIVGRKDVTLALGEQLARRRLVSIVGPGGIGKTTVALAVASEHVASYEHGAVFVDLAPLVDPERVPAALAFALGYQTPSESPLAELCEFLRDRRILLVLDNCEHVLGAAAHLVERVMKAAPDVHILATTREPLLAEGEWVHRLSALVAPALAEKMDHEQALAFSAIRLFVERAEASTDSFALSGETLPAVRQLCHRLDGLPLAIELAAARVGTLGVSGLAQRLDDLFRLLNRGRRTAMPRHQTLEALLNWSFDLLTPQEQVVFQRLSVFRASFSLDSAISVAASSDLPPSVVTDCVLSLAMKSLLHTDGPCQGGQYRLLYMTRDYAAHKLSASGEMPALQRRHAELCVLLAESSGSQWGELSAADRVRTYGRLIDDFRTALDWSFSPEGDDHLAASLTAAVWIPTVGVGLSSEYRTCVERALERVTHLAPPQPLLELRLCVAWCFLSGQSPGTDGERQAAVFARALALAEQIGDVERHTEVLYSVCVGSLGQGRYDLVAELAARIKTLVSGPSAPLSVLVGDRMMTLAHHHLGRHAEARRLAGKVIDFPMEPRHRWFVGNVPRAVSLGIVEARILWMQGASDRALAAAQRAAEAAIGEHPFALSQAMALAMIPISLWRGDNALARGWIDVLLDHTIRHSIGFWQSWGESYRRVVERRIDPSHRHAAGRNWTTNPPELDMLATLAPDLLRPETIERVRRGRVAWCAPEVLRAQGENLLAAAAPAAAEEAAGLFSQALALAREQGALAWELRAATSLAALWAESDPQEAHALLARTVARFTEGLHTMDLVHARELLGELTVIRAGAEAVGQDAQP